MSAICGSCGKIIFVSKRKDWTTQTRYPEISCDNQKCKNFSGKRM